MPTLCNSKVYRDSTYTHLTAKENIDWTLCGQATHTVKLQNQKPILDATCPDCRVALTDPTTSNLIPTYEPAMWAATFSSKRWHIGNPLEPTQITLCNQTIGYDLDRRYPEEATHDTRICKTCLGRVPLALIPKWFPQL